MRKRVIGPIVSNCHPIDQPNNSIRHAKNAIQNRLLGATTNEPGFLRSGSKIPYTFNGVIETDDKPVIFSTDDVNSAIGYYDKDSDIYIPILDDKYLPFKIGFRRTNHIKGEFQKNNLGEYVIAFTDKNLPPMYLNCDNPGVSKMTDLLFFHQPKVPVIDSKVSDGGQLVTGSYKAYVKLVNIEGSETHYLASSSYRSISENGSGAIALSVSNIDQSYTQVVIAFLIRSENTVKAIQLDPFPVSESIEVLYTGTENFINLTPAEILVGSKSYSKVGAIGQLNGSIYFGNVVDDEDIDYQEYANSISVSWKSRLVDCRKDSPDAVMMKTSEIRSFCHDEVYAFYIRLVLNTGSKTKAFHIPGPEPSLSDMEEITYEGFSGSRFHFYDTIKNFSAVEKVGRTGVWVNEAESYPAGFGDLTGKKVRHHKMPSQWFIKTNLYPDEATFGTSHSNLLGVKLEGVTIPKELKDRVVGYEILYAKRTGNNTSILGQSPVTFNVEHRLNPIPDVHITDDNVNTKVTEAELFSSGGNWDNRTGYDHKSQLFWMTNKLTYNSARLHPIEAIENNIRLNQENSYLKIDNILSTKAIVDTKSERTCVRTILLDYTNAQASTLKPLESPIIAKISGMSYIKANLPYKQINGVNNTIGEDAIVVNLADGAIPKLPVERELINITLGSGTSGGSWSREVRRTGHLSGEDTYLATLKVFKRNVYQSFLTQILIETEVINTLTSSDFIFRGDVLKAQHTIHQVAPIGFSESPVPLYTAIEHEYSIISNMDKEIEDAEAYTWDGGIRVIRNILVETAVNLYTRFKKPGIHESEWYFNTLSTKYAFEWDCHKDPNDIGYTKDLNPLSEAISEVFSNRRTTNVFPYRIHRGGKMELEGQSKDWRRFLPLDYYDMQKNLGPIINIQGLDDNLLIHLKNALLVTRDKTRLETTDSLGVILGSADIFQFSPQEVISSKLGIGGLQSDLACILTPMGYFFMDSSTGEVYVFKGELQKINGGLEELFTKYGTLRSDNVLDGNGVTLGFDPEYKRLLLTVKNTYTGGNPKRLEQTDQFMSSLETGDVVLIDGEYMELVAIE